MNILPTKSWHVRRPENKERVRRDEENARLEEKKEQDRISLAEKEARIAYLRRKNIANSSDSEAQQAVVREEHINLFSTEEEAGASGIKKDNVDYIKEKNEEKEKYEKKIGLLKYIGQSDLDAKNEGKLWYMEMRAKTDTQNNDSEVEECKKSKLDPLAIIEEHTKHKRSKKEHKKKKKKKEKEKYRLGSSSKSIESLREERLKRERVERGRADQLINKDDTPDVIDDAKIGNDRGKYFNQFHPELARKKRDY